MHWRQVPIHYCWYIFTPYARVPDIVRIDEHDRPILVPTGANVSKYGCRWHASQLHLVFESRKKFAPTLRAAAPLTRRGTDEDLAELPHTQILCRNQEKSNVGFGFQVSPTQGPCAYGTIAQGEASRGHEPCREMFLKPVASVREANRPRSSLRSGLSQRVPGCAWPHRSPWPSLPPLPRRQGRPVRRRPRG